MTDSLRHALLDFWPISRRSFDAKPYWHGIGGGAKKVARHGARLGMMPSQFVAHFLMEELATPQKLNPTSGLEELKQVVNMVGHFEGCDVLTIPVGPVSMSRDDSKQELLQRTYEKLARYAEVVRQGGCRFALELITGGLIGWSEFCSLRRDLGPERIGLNLDTGHTGTWGDLPALLRGPLKNSIFGVHLKDQTPQPHHKQTPGQGAIVWETLLLALQGAAYQGSLDVEILCPVASVHQEYTDGRNHVVSVLDKQAAPPVSADPQIRSFALRKKSLPSSVPTEHQG